MGIWDSVTGLFGGGKPGPGGKSPNVAGESPTLNFGYGVLNPIQEPDIFIEYEKGTTSGVDILKNLSEERYSVNTMQSIGQFKAVCLRVDGLLEEVTDSWLPEFLENEKGEMLIAVKARIPEIHSFLPDPFEIKKQENKIVVDQKIVDMHPTFIAVSDKIDVPVPGDIINVDFGNRVNMTDPKYYGVVFSQPLGLNISVTAGGGFGGSQPAGKLLTDTEGRVQGHVEKCDPKTQTCKGGLNSKGHDKNLSPETKEFLKILDEEAKHLGITVFITSGKRTSWKQASIMYNNFWGSPGGGTPSSRERYLKGLYRSKSFPNVEAIIRLFESSPKPSGTKKNDKILVKDQAADIIEKTWKPLGHRTGTAFDLGFRPSESEVGQALRQAAVRSNVRILREKDHFHVSLTPGKASGWANL